ncbi:MAG: hypothetical protein IIW23_03530, partial [Clostridia bacterium]|nr:hypothetical protein [Clostridia bacterium]
MKTMKKITGFILCLVMVFTLVAPGIAAGAARVIEHHLIMPDDFDTIGTWKRTTDDLAFNSTTLQGEEWRDTSNLKPAVATVTVETAGEYTLWVHAKVQNIPPTQASSWLFQAAVDGNVFDTIHGGGNRPAKVFEWEKSGTITLEA